MTDTAQTILIFVLVILTALLIVLSVQVFLILKDLRRTVNKANKVLDDTGIITESVTGPISKLSSFASGVKVAAFIASFLKRKKKKDE